MNLILYQKNQTKLACHGGNKVRNTPMPSRFALGPNEEAMITKVIRWYRKRGLDPGYQGYFEEEYCNLFSKFHGGGYADAVATGTIAIYVALKALELPENSHVLVSPITDAGTLSAIILAGLKPKVVDTQLNNFNINFFQVKKRFDPNVSCLVIVHAAGQPVKDTADIIDWARQLNIPVLEDCSQAHGAMINKRKVGTFGDIAAFSTMYRKVSISGSSGGIVFTKNKALYYKVLAHADRGKPVWKEDFDYRDPNQFLFPALNFHHDEIGCGIGIASFKRLSSVIHARLTFVKQLYNAILKECHICKPYTYTVGDSPFYYPIFVDQTRIKCSKYEFACAIRAEGIDLNPHYQYLVCQWPWVQKHLADNYFCENAYNLLNICFCLYLNENYGDTEVNDIVLALKKIESYYQK